MKKSKLSLCLVTSFITAMALSACDVTAKKNALVTFTPYGGGDPVDIVTDAMYQKYRDANDGVNKFYTQILEVLIRYKFEKGGIEGALTKAEIAEKAASDVKEQKQKAKDSASSNGTTYDKEWNNILDSYGVDNAKELKEVFIFNREKEEISKWFLNTNVDTLKSEFIGVTKEGAKVNSDVDSALPYHIRHILVKVESGAKDFYSGTISSTESTKLYNTISKLKDGKQSFAQVAYDESEDGSGKSAYGDVGIVTNKIQSSGSLEMVSEFQLGAYAYDMMTRANNNTIADGLGLNGLYQDTNTTIKNKYQSVTDIVKVPYEAVTKLGEYAKVEKDDYGNELSDGNAMVFPRNIIWNKYFNHHQVFVITNAKANIGDNNNNATNAMSVQSSAVQFKNLCKNEFVDCGPRFVSVNGLTTGNEKVLTDGQGHVIIGVRSEFGIHLMVIQQSIYDFANSDVTLDEYYTTEIPTSSKYPKTSDNKEKDTYVNFINTTAAEYNTRANTVKDKIKGFDSTYDYRLYEYLMDQYKSAISFKGEEGKKLSDAIANYINVTRESASHNQQDKLNTQWESYIEMLELQEDTRSTYYAFGKNDQNADMYKTKLVPEGCAVNFHKGGKDYEEGGKCYYGK